MTHHRDRLAVLGARAVCLARPALVEAAMTNDANAWTDLAYALVDHWNVRGRSAEGPSDDWLVSTAIQTLGCYFKLSAVDLLALLAAGDG